MSFWGELIVQKSVMEESGWNSPFRIVVASKIVCPGTLRDSLGHAPSCFIGRSAAYDSCRRARGACSGAGA